jgi:hypothetical protein
VFGGKTGWIGIQLVDLLKSKGKDVVIAETRIENLEAVSKVISISSTLWPTNFMTVAVAGA